MVLNKMDLLPYVDFRPAVAIENARRIQPSLEVISVSCVTGEGLDQWMLWLEKCRAMAQCSIKTGTNG